MLFDFLIAFDASVLLNFVEHTCPLLSIGNLSIVLWFMSSFLFHFPMRNYKMVPFPLVMVLMVLKSSSDCIRHVKFPKTRWHWYFGRANEAIRSRQPVFQNRKMEEENIRNLSKTTRKSPQKWHLPECC